MTGDSIRDQYEDGRIAGAGSSPAFLAKLTKSQKTKLWKRLRRLDREIAKVDYQYNLEFRSFFRKQILEKKALRYGNLDKQRKQVRQQLKGYI